MIPQDFEAFLMSYYSALAKTPSTLSSLFTADSKLSISKEGDTQKTFLADFDRAILSAHGKKIAKILIVSNDVLTFGQNSINMVVIAQVQYEDMSISRFVESFVIEDNKILTTVIKILDEEIIYQKDKKDIMNSLVNNPRKSVFISQGSKLTYKNVIETFGSFGKIVAYEKRGDDAYIEFDSYEAADSVKEEKSKLGERGIKIEKDRVYERKRYNKNSYF